MSLIVAFIVSTFFTANFVNIWLTSPLFAGVRLYTDNLDNLLGRLLRCDECLSVWVGFLTGVITLVLYRYDALLDINYAWKAVLFCFSWGVAIGLTATFTRRNTIA